MSQIETHAKRQGTRLLLGQPTLLDHYDQATIAALIALIVMRVEFLGDAPSIPKGDRDWLITHREPSQHWSIWITNFGGADADQHWSRSYSAQLESAPPDKVGPEYCNVRIATFVMGQLCAHAYYSRVVPLGGYDGVHLGQIWPVQHPYLNTGLIGAISDDGVTMLHEAFARESRPWPN